MSSELKIAGAPLSLRVCSRARKMRLRVDPRSASVLLTVPRRVSSQRAIAWAVGQTEWVERVLSEIPPIAPITPGSTLPFRGRDHVIAWDSGGSRAVRVQGDEIRVGGPSETLDLRVLRWLKAEARTLLEQESRVLADSAGASLARVGIGDPISRWGSCSSSGNIRYSWRLILAPDFVRRATVAHEVAHLVHLNHGREFHHLVERLLGQDPRPARLWLRKNGAGLHRIGRRV